MNLGVCSTDSASVVEDMDRGRLFQDGRVDVFEFGANTGCGIKTRLFGMLNAGVEVAVAADEPSAVDVRERMCEPDGDFEAAADRAGNSFDVAGLCFVQQTEMQGNGVVRCRRSGFPGRFHDRESTTEQFVSARWE